MDQLDRRLLSALADDGRATFADLARAVGLSSSAVHERVSKLEATAAIRGYRAVLDPQATGGDVTALVAIEAGETARDEDIAEAVRNMPEVESCYALAGDQSFLLLVRVGSVDRLQRLLQRLRAIDGVARTRTTLVLDTLFEGRVRRLDEEPPLH